MSKWLIVAPLLVVGLAPLVAACQVTPEFVRAALCEPAVPADPVGEPVPEVSEPSSW